MKDNKMSQKELAQKLNVSPQYINKLLHGQDLDLKITTVMKYGRILGLKLIVIPEEETTTVKEVICITTTALYNEAGTNQFKYNRSKAIVGLRCNS
jgi:transcriptional regulator with XRE-family HTH domain